MKKSTPTTPRQKTGGFPVWWHHHGFKMRAEPLDKEKCILVISGSAAKITIKNILSEYPNYSFGDGWLVDWEVHQWTPLGLKTIGRRQFNNEELLAAFGISSESGDTGGWLIEEFGAESAQQGKYIRWKEYLNIPCPGTGHDGDPNVSVYIEEDIEKAIKQLLEL
ncbi:MAG: hypothetical protein PHH83_02510 [Patescibacteria group bacterium]|nr:hypothetical protein [Patescibacteria group bacterium]